MPVEENKEGGEKAPAFDAKKFKEEMMDQNKQFMETTMQTIQGNVKSMIEGSMAALKPAESRSAPKGGLPITASKPGFSFSLAFS